MADENKKDFNAMLNDCKDIVKKCGILMLRSNTC